MPYTPHATWVAGDVPVAADLNNWEAGIDGADAVADASAATITAIAGSRALVYNNAAQSSLSSSSYTKVALNAEVYDAGAEFDTTNNRFVASASGNYLVTSVIEVNKATPAVNNVISTVLYKNGVLYGALCRHTNGAAVPSGTYSASLNGSLIIPLVASDYLEVFIYPVDSSWNIPASVATGNTHVGFIRIS